MGHYSHQILSVFSNKGYAEIIHFQGGSVLVDGGESLGFFKGLGGLAVLAAKARES